MTRVAILLLLCVPALAADELAGLARLVGGQWRSEGKLPNGRAVRSRVVATWGTGQSFLRTRSYIVTDKGEYLRYETLTFWHPGEKRIAYITFSADRNVTRGTVTITGATIRYEQPKSATMPPMRNVFVFTKGEPDAYVGTVSWQKDGAWTPVMSAPSAREPLKPGPALAVPVNAGPMAPFAKLIGRWTISDAEMHGVSVSYAWSLPGCLLETQMSSDGEPTTHAFYWWDPDRRGFASLALSPGEVGIGEADFADGTLTSAWGWVKRDGTTTRFREALARIDDDRYTFAVSTQEVGGWHEIFRIEQRRVKK